MGKTLKPEHLAELAALRDRSLFVYEYMSKHATLNPLAAQLRDAIEDAYAAQNLRGLRTIKRDFDEWCKSLPDALQRELNRLLESRLGVDSGAEARGREKEVREIAARGRIRNEREYRAVASFVEEFHDKPSRAQEIPRLNELLSQYSKGSAGRSPGP
jgi:hypothetical protein